jgi:sugar lactone lactonase YvrE
LVACVLTRIKHQAQAGLYCGCDSVTRMQPKHASLVSIASLFLGVVGAVAQRGPAAVLNPREYTSPSGTFVLTVDPSDLYGRGDGDYRVTKQGVVVWEGRKPFTLYEAGITEDGLIGGYAYTHGIEGHFRESGNSGLGEFHVVIMRGTGEVLLDDVVKRTGSRYLHAPPNPLAKGILVDGSKDRLVVVVLDENVNRRENSWWTYELSTGKRLGKYGSGPEVPPPARPAEITPPALPEFPSRPLKLLGQFTLDKPGAATTSPIRNISGFDIDSRGQIGFIRRDGPGKFSFALIAPDGRLLRDTSLAIPDALTTNGSPKAAWVESNRWVVVASRNEVGSKAAAWWLNDADGTLTSIAGFDSPYIEEIVGLRGGGFVALAKNRRQYSIEDQLICFDPTGQIRWRLRQDNNGGTGALFSPKDITVTSDNRIAVLDVIRHTVQFFSTNENFLGAVKLDDAWGRKPNYPSRLTADKEGGVLVQDFRGNPPLVRMDADGKVIVQFQPKHPDGRIIDSGPGIKVDPSGRVWVCDGKCFLRLSDKGVAERVLGAAPTQESLNRIATLTVDQQGRLYAVDDRTGAVHVYDQTGSRLRVCKPDPSDIKSTLFRAHVTAFDDGTVYFSDGESFSRKQRFIQYASDGRRVGWKEFGLDGVKEHWFALPQPPQFLVVGYHNAFLVDEDGKVARTIQRRPDRNWLDITRGASVAADGSFAILSGGGYWSREPWHVNLYSTTGDPVRMVTMPVGFMDSCFAYTGRHLATRTESELCLFKATGEPLLKFSPPVDDFNEIRYQRWACFASLGGRELWLASLDRKSVWRFELP